MASHLYLLWKQHLFIVNLPPITYVAWKMGHTQIYACIILILLLVTTLWRERRSLRTDLCLHPICFTSGYDTYFSLVIYLACGVEGGI
jgi:predicted small integral membrane protein